MALGWEQGACTYVYSKFGLAAAAAIQYSIKRSRHKNKRLPSRYFAKALEMAHVLYYPWYRKTGPRHGCRRGWVGSSFFAFSVIPQDPGTNFPDPWAISKNFLLRTLCIHAFFWPIGNGEALAWSCSGGAAKLFTVSLFHAASGTDKRTRRWDQHKSPPVASCQGVL
jgi:hypothetical protein